MNNINQITIFLLFVTTISQPFYDIQKILIEGEKIENEL